MQVCGINVDISNEYWGANNRRFDRRSAVLRELGYSYVQLIDGVAGYQRLFPFRTDTITASMVAHADSRSWLERLAEVSRRIA